MPSPKVSVCIITYNHEKYIRQCLDGVLMQETDFPIEVLIHDDASTDGTVEILKEYHSRHPNLIRLILQEENQYSKGYDHLSMHLYSQISGEYVAFCEGDDYWTNHHKLHKQIEFLDKNLDISISSHVCEHRFEGVKRGTAYQLPFSGDFRYSFKDELESHFIATASAVIRTRVFREKPENWSPLDLPLAMGDIVTFLHSLSKGDGFHFSETMCVKRKNPTSISRNADYNKHIRIQSFFAWLIIEKTAPAKHKKVVQNKIVNSARTILIKQRNYPKSIIFRVAIHGVFKRLISYIRI